MSGEQVTVHRHTAGAKDAHGNATSTFADVTVDDVAVAPRQGEEQGNNRDTVIIGWTVYLPPGTEISPHDEMTVRGVRCTVIGEPGVWTSPYTETTHGIQVALERIEG